MCLCKFELKSHVTFWLLKVEKTKFLVYYPPYIVYRLPRHRAAKLYRVGSLHPQRHYVTTGVLITHYCSHCGYLSTLRKTWTLWITFSCMTLPFSYFKWCTNCALKMFYMTEDFCNIRGTSYRNIANSVLYMTLTIYVKFWTTWYLHFPHCLFLLI